MHRIIGALALALASTNAAAHAKTPEPIGSLEGVFTGNDYPEEALKKNEQGGVGIVVQIDSTGAISDCIIDKSSGSALLDKRTCDVIRERAKFKPARDRKGRPIESQYRQMIYWRIAKDMLPSDPWAIRTVIEFGPYGDAVSCRMEPEGAMQLKSGYRPHPCPSNVMKRNVSGETRFGGPIDRVIMDQRFAPGPAQTPPLGPDEVLSGKEVYQIEIDIAGKVTSCKLTERSGPPGAADPCPALNKEFFPRNGPDGKPAPFSATQILDAIVHVDRSRAPRPVPLNGSLQGLITSDDYPSEALDRGDQGRVGIVIRTDPKGTISDCVVEESSGSAILDKQTCVVMRQRAKFKPPLDGQGRAVAGEYRTRINWKMADEMAPSDPWAIRTIINFASDGRALSCHMEFEGAMKPQPGAPTPACGADAMGGAPPKVADLPGAIATVVMEQRFAIGRVPAPLLAAGDVLVSRQVMSLDVDAEGALTSCRVIESNGEESGSDPCSQVDKLYLLHKGRDGRPVPFTATETISVYVRVEKVAFAIRPRTYAQP